MRISDWISDVGSSDLLTRLGGSPIALTAIGPLSGSEQPAIQSRAPATTVRIIGDRIAIASFDNASPERLLGPFASSDRSTFTGLSSIRCSTEGDGRSEEHTSELQSLMRISYAVFCLKK